MTVFDTEDASIKHGALLTKQGGPADSVNRKTDRADEIKYHWPEHARRAFGKDILIGSHDGGKSDLFSDEGLAALLDAYPREKLGIYRFPDHGEGTIQAVHGCAPDLTGAEILYAVKTGCIWLNLRGVNKEVEAYSGLAASLFRQLEEATGTRTMKNDMGVLISSPGIHVHYHLDIPKVCLVQIRGIKTVHFYPVGAPFAEPDQMEKIVLREQDEELCYSHDFEAHATVLELKPGMAVTWPQTAPHRVQNADMMNVSLSCEFMTAPAIIKANALYANAKLRRLSGYSAPFPKTVGPVTAVKAVGAQIYKKIQPARPTSPTSLSFELAKDGSVLPLSGSEDQQAESGHDHTQPYVTRVSRVNDLSNDDIRQWNTICASDFQYASPLLSPEFTKLIASVRSDVRVVLTYQGETLVGVLPVHERGGGLLRPVGGPFCDYSGPLFAQGADLTLNDMLEGAGICCFRSATSVLAPEEVNNALTLDEGSFVINLRGRSSEDYLELRRSLHPKRFKNFRRLISKLHKDHQTVEFAYGAPKAEDLDRLLAWKSAQFVSDGLMDVTKARNSAAILKAVSGHPYEEDEGFGAFMTCLKVDGALVAGHFGIRRADTFHPWISAYDPAFEDYSPGVLLLYRVIEEMEAMGLQAYDLAGGHEYYKKYFAEPERYVKEVLVSRPTLPGRVQHAGYSVWNLIGARNPQSLAARIRRRMDHAAVCEPSWGLRIRDFFIAVLKRGSSPSHN